MRCCLFFLLFIITQVSNAQKREELFDNAFKPATTGAYYFVTTEKKDSGWYREAWYVSQKSLALKAWYKDETCKVPHGLQEKYHHNRFLKSKGEYANGQKEGMWLTYSEKGFLTDSTTYRNNKPVGISIGWHESGYLRDSTHFDEAGNGVRISWYDDGAPASAGRLNADEKKLGRWQYFHKNGTVMATEDYDKGNLKACLCYTEDGKAIDTTLCTEKEAEPNGGVVGWRRFLERSLLGLVERKANSREWSTGQFTVLIRFLVEKDGSLSDFVALTAYGKGVEEEVISLLKRAPKWTPGRQWGKVVRSYHTQPISFMIQ